MNKLSKKCVNQNCGCLTIVAALQLWHVGLMIINNMQIFTFAIPMLILVGKKLHYGKAKVSNLHE